MRIRAIAFLALAGLAAAAARADGDDVGALEALLQREVQGPSRYAQSLLDAPAAVSVIDQHDAALLGHQTVADMLGRLPGIYYSRSRQYLSVGLRGFNRPGDYNARLLMAIDGFRTNDAIYDQALPEYEFPLVAEWVKRVELVQGPSSSVYGGNALLGVVNIVTQDGADAPGLRLKGTVGSFGTRRALAQYGSGAGGDSDLFIGAQVLRSEGENLDLPELGVPRNDLRGLDGLRHASLFAKLRRGDWRATLTASQRDKDVATAPYGTQAGAPGTRYRDQYGHAELAYDEGWRDALRRSLRLGLAFSDFEGRYVYDGAPVNHDKAHATWATLDLRLNWRGWLNHDVVFGADGRWVPGASQRNADEGAAKPLLDVRASTRNLGLYAQDQWRWSEFWKLTAGLRMDVLSSFRTEWSPRVALVYLPRPGEAIKLLVGRSFRMPNLAERFYEDGVSQVANPVLRPETLQTVELSWERPLDAQTALSVHAYRTQMDRMIEFVPFGVDGLSRYENQSAVSTRGADVGLEHRGRGDLQWRLDLSLMDARSHGVRLSNSPTHLLKGHVIARLGANWSLGLEGQAMGRREGREPVAGHALFNALWRFTGMPGQVLALRVLNLTDRRYFDPAGPESDPLRRVPQQRRSVQLEWQFML